MGGKSKYIERFEVQQMWGRITLQWENIQEDINILVGINGGGKTTLLNLIYDYYTGKTKKKSQPVVKGNTIESSITFIRSFDVPAKAKKNTESMLLQELKHTINQNGEGTSFFDYRMKMLNFPEEKEKIQKRINDFFLIINALFKETNKEISIDPKNNTLVFRIKEWSAERIDASGYSHSITNGVTSNDTDEIVELDQLSSGEKQMLLILTTVFLQEEKPNILLMDEPEISLHISWQDRLIGTIRQLNPNCQLILATHSPNIFANGWEDKIVFIDDLEVE